jgi:hypothetical protein
LTSIEKSKIEKSKIKMKPQKVLGIEITPPSEKRKQLYAAIHAQCQKQGIDDDTRRNMMWQGYRKYSLKFFDESQLEDLLAILSGRRRPDKEASRSPITGRPDQISSSARAVHGETQYVTPDQWRKRLMAAIASWAKLINYIPSNEDINEAEQDLTIPVDKRSVNWSANATVIKAIACRAAGNVESFNAIPVDRLRNLYYAFVKKRRDYEAVQNLPNNDNQNVIVANNS